MTTVLIKHPVEDYDKWKNAFDAFIDNRKAGGEKSYHIYRTINNQNNVVVIFEWDNAENAITFLQSDQLKAAMQQAGVAGPPDINIMETADKGETLV